jgi:uncharacterized membrane protein
MNNKPAIKRLGINAWIKQISAGRLVYFSLISGIIGQTLMYVNKNIPAGVFFFIIAIVCLILADKNTSKPGNAGKDLFQISFTLPMKTEMILFSLIIAVAAFMRLFEIDLIPAGCYYDEALNGLAAIDILHGKSLPIYLSPEAANNAAVFMYYIAVAFKFFGIGATQIRLVSAILGILAVPAFYFLIRYMAGSIPALIGAFILAIMRWHIIFSRIGFHATFGVLLVILVLYFIIRAYYEEKTIDFILLGFTLSFSLYFQLFL